DNSYYDEAKTFFVEAQQMGIDDLSLYILLVRTFLKLSEKENASRYLEEGISRYPNSPLLEELKNSLDLTVQLC
ncbi:MAG: hypothetical protein HY779_01485, partial [Rubrobacteridae bacterium]|nr:hypothetical protein [Rubrobacteridae bacterium]